jgi:hypothetical protein
VHQAWVDAVRQHDRRAALALAASDRSVQVEAEAILDSIQQLIQSRSQAGSIHGSLRTVEVLGVRNDGTDKVGISRWRFQTMAACFYTHLRDTPDGWRVVGAAMGEHLVGTDPRPSCGIAP